MTCGREDWTRQQVAEFIAQPDVCLLAVPANIAPMDFCPACSGGVLVDDAGEPLLDEDGRMIDCDLCNGSGLLVEHCFCGGHPGGEMHDEDGRVPGMYR